jgi:cell division topological specificity factor
MFGGLFGSRSARSKDVAKERLRNVLVKDRSDVSPQVLLQLSRDLGRVLSGYMDVDESRLNVELKPEDNHISLVARVPVRSIRRRP